MEGLVFKATVYKPQLILIIFFSTILFIFPSPSANTYTGLCFFLEVSSNLPVKCESLITLPLLGHDWHSHLDNLLSHMELPSGPSVNPLSSRHILPWSCDVIRTLTTRDDHRQFSLPHYSNSSLACLSVSMRNPKLQCRNYNFKFFRILVRLWWKCTPLKKFNPIELKILGMRIHSPQMGHLTSQGFYSFFHPLFPGLIKSICQEHSIYNSYWFKVYKMS